MTLISEMKKYIGGFLIGVLVACTNTSTAEEKSVDGKKHLHMGDRVVTRTFDCETGVLIYSSDSGLVAISATQMGVGTRSDFC